SLRSTRNPEPAERRPSLPAGRAGAAGLGPRGGRGRRPGDGDQAHRPRLPGRDAAGRPALRGRPVGTVISDRVHYRDPVQLGVSAVRTEFVNPIVAAAMHVFRQELQEEPRRGPLRLEGSRVTPGDVTVILGVAGDVEGLVLYGIDIATAQRMVR